MITAQEQSFGLGCDTIEEAERDLEVILCTTYSSVNFKYTPMMHIGGGVHCEHLDPDGICCLGRDVMTPHKCDAVLFRLTRVFGG
jgi:hypothetical protein